jgi:iron complex outermembrane recepter protein
MFRLLVRVDRYADLNPRHKNGDTTMRNLKMATKAALRSVLLSALCTTLLLSATVAAQAAEARSITYDLDIPAQSLNDALQAFALASQHKLLYSSELVDGKRSAVLKGKFTTEQAVKALLSGTHLSYEVTSDGLVLIRAADPPPGTNAATPMPNGSAVTSIRLAQAGAATAPSGGSTTTGSPVAASQGSSSATSAVETADIGEIIVTAQKKSERLQDVPVAITALNTDLLANNNLTRIQDYFAMVPGLSVAAGSQGGGTQQLAIRGITTGPGTNPTVGVVIDDVPYGNSTTAALGNLLYPDLDPSDLSGIEVLKGPQGTLYGSDSLGGLIKYVTKNPSTDGFSGGVQVQGEDVDHGGVGYAVRGSINIPLSNTFAIRASGFTRRDAGYIENISTGQRDINQVDVRGGHLSALWTPSDTVSLKVGALVQNTEGNGNSVVDTNNLLQPTLSDLQQTGIRGNGAFNSQIELFTAALKFKLGGVDFVSLSGYGINKWYALYDISVLGPAFAAPYFGVNGATEPNYYSTKKFTQEFRASSTIGQWLDWMVGAFYTHEDSGASFQNLEANDYATGAPVGQLIHWTYAPNTLSEDSLFADATVHFTDQFDVQVGGRESEYRQAYNEQATGLLVPTFYGVPSPYILGLERAKGNAFTYLVTPQYKFSRDLMTYVRIATGYRVGGPNISYPNVNTPASYNPDRTTNYELGVKGNVFNHALTFDVSLYYIDWQKIQLGENGFANGAEFGYTTNGAAAKSQGLEVSLQAHPFEGTAISLVTSLSDSVLTQNLPATSSVYGLSGQRLPFSSRFSGTFSVDQDIARIGEATVLVGGSVSYVGLRLGEFTTGPTPPPFQMPAFTTFNLHAGARYQSWLFNLFANNVGDKRGITGYSFYDGTGTATNVATIIPPRTVGLSVSKSF